MLISIRSVHRDGMMAARLHQEPSMLPANGPTHALLRAQTGHSSELVGHEPDRLAEMHGPRNRSG